MNEFIEKILDTLNKNGFPQKRVSLPTDRMFEAADNRGLSFNRVLEEMKTLHNIDADVGADKIIFSQTIIKENLNPEDLMKQAQDMMTQMDPEELRKLQETFMNMSPEEKEEILKKGKDLGLL